MFKISLTNLILSCNSKEFLLTNEFSEANSNAYKRVLNRQPFMKGVFGGP